MCARKCYQSLCAKCFLFYCLSRWTDVSSVTFLSHRSNSIRMLLFSSYNGFYLFYRIFYEALVIDPSIFLLLLCWATSANVTCKLLFSLFFFRSVMFATTLSYTGEHFANAWRRNWVDVPRGYVFAHHHWDICSVVERMVTFWSINLHPERYKWINSATRVRGMCFCWQVWSNHS